MRASIFAHTFLKKSLFYNSILDVLDSGIPAVNLSLTPEQFCINFRPTELLKINLLELPVARFSQYSCFKLAKTVSIIGSSLEINQDLFLNWAAENMTIEADTLIIKSNSFSNNDNLVRFRAKNPKFEPNSFSNLGKLTELIFSGDIVEAPEGTFNNISITNFTIQQSWENFSYKAFVNCPNLITIDNLQNVPNTAFISNVANFSKYSKAKLNEVVILSKNVKLTDITSHLNAFDEIGNLILYLNNDETIPKNSFINNKISSIDLSYTSISTIASGAFKDMTNLNKITFPANNPIKISENGFNNIGISEFELTPNIILDSFSFINCKKLKNLILKAGVTTFTLKSFRFCNISSVNISEVTDSFTNYRGYVYTKKEVQNSKYLPLDTLERKERNKLLFVPFSETLIPLDTEYDPYAFSYVNRSFDINYVKDENDKSKEVKTDEFMDYCNASSSRVDRVYFPMNTNLNNNNPDYFKCNDYSCDVYCNGSANVEPSDSYESSSSSELDPNKNYTYTYTRTNVTTESETMTNETHETVIMTLDNSNDTSYSTTYAMQVIRTLLQFEKESDSLVIIELSDNRSGGSQLSPGKTILLVIIGLGFFVILAMIGIFLYRKTKYESSKEGKFDQMEEDLGYVKDPENEEFDDVESFDEKKDDVNEESFGVDKVPIYGSDLGESLDSGVKINQNQTEENNESY